MRERPASRVRYRAGEMSLPGTEDRPLIHPITGERIVFRKRARDTGGELFEMSVFLAPQGFIAAPHVHPQQEERFEVAGAPVVFKVAGHERLYQPGEVVVVPPGTPHVWWNPGTEEAATLVQPGPIGEWTFGELAGHLLGWRNRTLARLEAAAAASPTRFRTSPTPMRMSTPRTSRSVESVGPL